MIPHAQHNRIREYVLYLCGKHTLLLDELDPGYSPARIYTLGLRCHPTPLLLAQQLRFLGREFVLGKNSGVKQFLEFLEFRDWVYRIRSRS